MPPAAVSNLQRRAQSCRAPTFAGLDLEEPYGCVYSDAQRPAGLLILLDGELRERHTPPRANLLIDTVHISTRNKQHTQTTRHLPMNSHHDSIAQFQYFDAAAGVLPGGDDGEARIVSIVVIATVGRAQLQA